MLCCVQVLHVLSRPPPDWPHASGRFRAELAEHFLFPFDPSTHGTACFVCGPPGFTDECVKPVLRDMGFGDDNVTDFDVGWR